MFKNMIDKMVLNECEYSNNGFFREYQIKYQLMDAENDVIHFAIRGAFVLYSNHSEHFVEMRGYITRTGVSFVTCKPCEGYAE